MTSSQLGNHPRSRYYCPQCGMVARPDQFGALRVVLSSDGRIRVKAHDRYAFKNTTHFKSLSMVNVRCEGGYVNADKDKAP